MRMERKSLKTCLITGGEGFIGSHLADLLVKEGLKVYALVYGNPKNIEHLRGRMTFLPCDLKENAEVSGIVRRVRPEIVFHLAAQSFVTVSWEEPEETLKTNVLGTFYLLESIRKEGLDPVIEIMGSSSVYGPCVMEEMPLQVNRAFRPTSMYSVSKAAEDLLGFFYRQVYGMKIIRVRPFNMTGPRKVADACSDFARGIVAIEKGLEKVLKVGNLETVRDFTDGRDAVKALWLLARRGEYGKVYNLCSGRAYQMREVLEKMVSLAGFPVKYEVVPEKMRPYDDPVYIGDCTDLYRLGWRLEIPMEQTLSDLLAYWRAHLSEA